MARDPAGIASGSEAIGSPEGALTTIRWETPQQVMLPCDPRLGGWGAEGDRCLALSHAKDDMAVPART